MKKKKLQMDSGQLLSYLQTGRTCSLSSYSPFPFLKVTQMLTASQNQDTEAFLTY